MYNLSIIIVNWNTADLLCQCLESLLACDLDSCEVIVVDNASSDASVRLVENRFPDVRLVRNTDNVGFAKANNSAIDLSTSRYVCLLNSDTIVTPGSFQYMLGFMSDHSEAVACAPALRLPNGKLQLGGAGFELSLATMFNYLFLLSKFFPATFKGYYIHQEAFIADRRPLQVDWLSGTALMVRRSAIQEVGALDSSYFMYCEDVEWCDRLRGVGQLYYLAGAEIVHLNGGSAKKSDKVSTVWLFSLFKYYVAKYGPAQLKYFKVILLSGFFLRYVAYSLCALWNSSYQKQANAMLRYLLYTANAGNRS